MANYNLSNRKNGIDTVLSNFEHSIMCKKYAKNAIFTMLHRERQCCSNDELFHESLKELKDGLKRNGYPLKLIENKIKIFLNDPQKPV